MKKFKKIWLASFLSIYLLAGLLLFVPAYAQASIFDPTQNINFIPQIGVPNSEFTAGTAVGVGTTGINAQGNTVMSSDLLARYINAFYQWGLSIVAVIAVVVLMAGGLMWIASSGDSSLITKAKDMIIGSLSGMALLVGAWFFLNTINPQLTKLPALEMAVVSKVTMGCCEYSDKARIDSEKNCQKDGGSYKLSEIDKDSGDPAYYLVSGDKCVLPGCCITDAGTANAVCENRLKKDCSGNNTFVLKNCSSIIKSSLCKQGDFCQEAPNGALCSTGKVVPSYGINTTGENNYCYNNICWLGNGKLNEPCGNEPNAFCTKDFSLWSDPNNDSGVMPTPACTKPGYSHDDVGGRSCGIGLGIDLACCYPK